MKVAVIGAGGRMGAAIVRCARKAPGVEISAAIDRADHPERGRDVGLLAGVGEVGLTLGAERAALAAADVCIDFSFHDAVSETLRAAMRFSIPVVIGTTGFSEPELREVRTAARKIPVLLAPNMSIGMNALFAVVANVARVLGAEYDVEIVETHHRHKRDAPSGTALRLGRKAAEGRGQEFEEAVVYGRHGMTEERPAGQIGIHAVRAGDTVGDHTVLFSAEGERVELSHRATSRDTFAFGALRAAQWIVARSPGLYDMQDVLGL